MVPSDNAALKWEDKAIIAKGSEQVQELITKIQNKDITEPVVFLIVTMALIFTEIHADYLL